MVITTTVRDVREAERVCQESRRNDGLISYNHAICIGESKPKTPKIKSKSKKTDKNKYQDKFKN